VSRRRFHSARALLSDLLDRHETRPAAVRLFCYPNVEGFASVVDQDDFGAELAVVERAGGIEVRRRRSGGVDQIESVRLLDPRAVYQHLGRTPAPETASRAIAVVQADVSTLTLAEALDEVRSAWARGVSALGLAPGDSARLSVAARLAEALAARVAGAEPAPLDFRTFSRMVVGDSKALERLARAVSALVKRLVPTMIAPEMESPEEIFGAFGVVRTPQPFLVSGALAIDGVALPKLPYVGVPAEEAGRLSFVGQPAYVLIVENFTSFVRHARDINADFEGLVLYSSGFPSRSALRGITQLARLSAAPTYHWGDIDLGGLRIFNHLERALRAVDVRLKPHLMSHELLCRFGVTSRRRNWISALKLPADTGLALLAESLLQEPLDLELEQEAVAPTQPS